MANYARSLIGPDYNVGASSTFGPRQVAATAPALVVDLAALQAASSALQEQLSKDAQAVPDLGEMLTIRAYGYIGMIHAPAHVLLFQRAGRLRARTAPCIMTTAFLYTCGKSSQYPKTCSALDKVRSCVLF